MVKERDKSSLSLSLSLVSILNLIINAQFMSGKIINFVIQSHSWRHPQPDTQGDKNVYPVEEFYYKGDGVLKTFKFIKIGKQKEQNIKDKKLGHSLCILSIPEEQIEVEQ